MPDSSARVAIVVAVVGVLGTLGAALIANWDKIFSPSRQPPVRLESPQPTRPDLQAPTQPPSNIAFPATGAHPPKTDLQPPTEPTLNITGVWRDASFPANSAQVTQNGDSFQFTKRGVLPNGIGFQSSGSGTVVGQRYLSSYKARYQTGETSNGDCSGTVSVDGARLEMICTDSLLGIFPVAAVRQ